MASSKDLSHSVLHGSAEIVDFPCSICLTRDKKEVESANYCVDCDSNMCKACTKSHASFPSMASHQVVDISKASGTRAQRAPLPTQRCDEHHGKIIDKYCADHNDVACETCVHLYHRNCVQMKYIPKCAQGMVKSEELQAIRHSTKILLKDLKHRKSSQRDMIQQLDMAEAQSLQEVQDLTTGLHQYVETLAKSESAKITSEYQKKKGAVTKDMKVVEVQIDATESISKTLNDYQGDNKSELFVYIKQGEKNEKEAKQMLQTQSQSAMTIPTYKVNSAIERSLKNTKSLGEFKRHLIAKLNKEVNVKTGSDKSDCDITGACLLPDASVIIADCYNTSLKHLDTSYRLTSQLDMSTAPGDVCYTNSNNEVAVTLIREKKVQFVSVGATMKKIRSFSVGDLCKGIVYNEGQLFICCGDDRIPTGGSVRVYSLSGRALRTIQQNTAGQNMFTVTDYITVSSCGSKLHVTDENKGILTIDRTGNLLVTYTDPELTTAAGICTLENDDLLVCGFRSNNVLHASRDGWKLGVVLRKQDGIVKPQVVCYDCVHSRLIVSTHTSNTIKLYDIEMN